jgi:hypothetical protein
MRPTKKPSKKMLSASTVIEPEVLKAIEKFAKDREFNRSQALRKAIVTGLTTLGYLGEPQNTARV